MGRWKSCTVGLIPALLASMALLLSFVGNIYCETVEYNGDNGVTLRLGIWNTQKYELVEFPQDQYRVREVCVSHPSGLDVDAKWKTAKAFSIITPVLGGLLTVVLYFGPCWVFTESTWKSAGVLLLVCCFFQGLTLIILDSNLCKRDLILPRNTLFPEECDMGPGYKASIASVVLWFLAGVAMIAVIPVPTRPDPGPPETQTVTYEQKRSPDGTMTVEKTGVIKGVHVETPEVMAEIEEGK